ncbi:hypothetical protein IP65_07040 [Novosphingobium sp. AAP1]|nr:hypothetical protein IP65_07040 [Novosphingobium sp. AAP1]
MGAEAAHLRQWAVAGAAAHHGRGHAAEAAEAEAEAAHRLGLRHPVDRPGTRRAIGHYHTGPAPSAHCQSGPGPPHRGRHRPANGPCHPAERNDHHRPRRPCPSPW